MGSSFYSNLSNLEIFDYKMMSDKVFEYKSVDGSKFKFDVCGNHACSHAHHKDMEETKEDHHMKEESKTPRKMSIDSGRSSVTSEELDPSQPLFGFSDNYVSIVPIKVKSVIKRDQPCYSFVLLPK
jgi:hypothetical protein